VYEEGHRGRGSARAGLLWEDTSYSDNRVLMASPPNFDGSRHPTLIVYLHGNQSTLERDVLERQQIPAQIAAANVNPFLVAPQFAFDALDSSPGNFAQGGHFAAFIKAADEFHIFNTKIGAHFTVCIKQHQWRKHQLSHLGTTLVTDAHAYGSSASGC
jgi:hypothetical protein